MIRFNLSKWSHLRTFHGLALRWSALLALVFSLLAVGFSDWLGDCWWSRERLCINSAGEIVVKVERSFLDGLLGPGYCALAIGLNTPEKDACGECTIKQVTT